MSAMRKLKSFYNRIPEVTNPCPKGCTKCCEIVPWSRPEAELARALTGHYPSVTPQGKCCYATEEGCSVYEIRPFMCRIYGHGREANMHCDDQMSSEGIPNKEFVKLLNDYQKWVSKNGNTCIPLGAEEFIKREAVLNPKLKLKGFD